MKKDTFAIIFTVIGLAILFSALYFAAVSIICWIICFAFGMEFSWKLAAGVWAVIVLLRMVLSAAKSNGSK